MTNQSPAVRVELDGEPIADFVSFDEAAGWVKVLVSADHEAGLYRYRKMHGQVSVTPVEAPVAPRRRPRAAV